ncbi:alpha/beta fold hydrolase [Nonomuraea sp. NPDC050556]|uniref:alpha/beta fold hydrolase n=1 Tax=Nonomuraea sp. NPDC050556 TaxID=3364369 RepID=UPI0037A423CA
MTLGVALVSLAGGLVSALPAQAGGRDDYTGIDKLPWASCGLESYPTLQCAKLEVPLDYRHPGGAKVKIALSRPPATAPADERQGPLFLNPGGPGISGIAMAGWFPTHLPADVAATYDFIGFDLRLSQSSEPRIDCRPDYFQSVRPDYHPGAESTKAWLQRAALYAANCAAAASPYLPFLTNVDFARDLESVRKAFGVRQINYFGRSAGTNLGSTYATLFPNRVRRMPLEGTVGPQVSW